MFRISVNHEKLVNPEYINSVLDEIISNCEEDDYDNLKFETTFLFIYTMRYGNQSVLKKFMSTKLKDNIFENMLYFDVVCENIVNKKYDMVDVFFEHKQFIEDLEYLKNDIKLEKIFKKYLRYKKLNEIFYER